MPECPEGFRWYKDARRVRGGSCRDVAKRRASNARYNATDKGVVARIRGDRSEKGRARHARADRSEKGRARLARFRVKRDADPLRRLRYLNNRAQYYRRQHIAGLEQQLKEL